MLSQAPTSATIAYATNAEQPLSANATAILAKKTLNSSLFSSNSPFSMMELL